MLTPNLILRGDRDGRGRPPRDHSVHPVEIIELQNDAVGHERTGAGTSHRARLATVLCSRSPKYEAESGSLSGSLRDIDAPHGRRGGDQANGRGLVHRAGSVVVE